jgi:hypothetical protein
MKQLSELNIEDLVRSVFPYNKDHKIVFSQYVKKGIAKWETWFVVIYRGEILDDYLLFTVCGHSEYTRTKYLQRDFNLEDFKRDFQKAVSLGELHYFYSFNKMIYSDNFMQLNEMTRLSSYLGIRHIKLFEPTE